MMQRTLELLECSPEASTGKVDPILFNDYFSWYMGNMGLLRAVWEPIGYATALHEMARMPRSP
jgi:hypothetical protein